MRQTLLRNGRAKREDQLNGHSPRHSVECAGTRYSLKGCAPAEPFSASPDVPRMLNERRSCNSEDTFDMNTGGRYRRNHIGETSPSCLSGSETGESIQSWILNLFSPPSCPIEGSTSVLLDDAVTFHNAFWRDAFGLGMEMPRSQGCFKMMECVSETVPTCPDPVREALHRGGSHGWSVCPRPNATPPQAFSSALFPD